MATESENTLTIRDVMGISRYYSSTNTPPNKPYTLQNLYSPKRGELAIIPGVAELTHTMPFVSNITDITFLEQTSGEQGWMVHYDIDSSSIAAPPTSFTFSAPTGTPSGTRDVIVEYVYPGGSTYTRVFSAKSYGTSGGVPYMDITLPTSAAAIDPTGAVYCINYYIVDSVGDLVTWCGSHMKKDGIFPISSNAEATIRIPVPTSTPTGANLSIGDVGPTGFSFTPTSVAGGNLTPGRMYYFGVCPYLTQKTDYYRLNKVSLYPSSTTSNGRMAAFLPAGYNAFSISFTGLPTSTGNVLTTAVNYYQVFAGKTPESMAPIGDTFVYQAVPNRTAGSTTLTVQVKDMPYNTNQVMTMATYEIPTSGSQTFPLGVAISGRVYGSWYYQTGYPSGVFPVDKTRNKGLAYIQFPYSATSHKEQLPGSQFTFTVDQNFSSLTSKRAQTGNNPDVYGYNYGFNFQGPNDPRATVYQDLSIYVNGYGNPYQSNGDLVAPFVGDDQRVIPITTNIALYNDRLVLGCGPINWSYDKGLIFYSDAGQPTDFGTGAGNFLNVNFGDASDLVGFGAFSKDLADSGPTAFLVIGKVGSTYVWNGGTTAADQQLVQVGKALGWLSANSFGLTKNGPVVVTNQGLYSVNGSDMNGLDPGTESFFTEMSASLHQYVNVVYTDDRLIVGYSDSSSRCNKELWYDFRDEPDGSIVVVPTGPHSMQDYKRSVNALVYGTTKNYRVSWNSSASSGTSKIYRRDIPGTFTNVGSDISWIYELNETGLGSDEFLKILTRMYIRAKINKQEVITITVPSYDSSSDGLGLDYTGTGLQTVSETLTMPYTGATEIYRLFQKVFSSRYRGAIFKPKFTGATNLDFRIISVSILSELKRRRML